MEPLRIRMNFMLGQELRGHGAGRWYRTDGREFVVHLDTGLSLEVRIEPPAELYLELFDIATEVSVATAVCGRLVSCIQRRLQDYRDSASVAVRDTEWQEQNGGERLSLFAEVVLTFPTVDYSELRALVGEKASSYLMARMEVGQITLTCNVKSSFEDNLKQIVSTV